MKVGERNYQEGGVVPFRGFLMTEPTPPDHSFALFALRYVLYIQLTVTHINSYCYPVTVTVSHPAVSQYLMGACKAGPEDPQPKVHTGGLGQRAIVGKGAPAHARFF